MILALSINAIQHALPLQCASACPWQSVDFWRSHWCKVDSFPVGHVRVMFSRFSFAMAEFVEVVPENIRKIKKTPTKVGLKSMI